MKKVFVLILFATTVLSCSSSSVQNGHREGAFEKADASSERIVRISGFVEGRLQKDYPGLKIVKTKEAEIQVVAGTNYRLECSFIFKGKKGTLHVTVYEDLELKREITFLEIN